MSAAVASRCLPKLSPTSPNGPLIGSMCAILMVSAAWAVEMSPRHAMAVAIADLKFMVPPVID